MIRILTPLRICPLTEVQILASLSPLVLFIHSFNLWFMPLSFVGGKTCPGSSQAIESIFFQTFRLLWRLFVLASLSGCWSGIVCYIWRTCQIRLRWLWCGCRVIINPEPFCGLSTSQFREVVDVWLLEEISLHWIEAPGLRRAKRLISPLAVKVELLTLLRRLELRTLVTALLITILIR